jgi:hypothetical protein
MPNETCKHGSEAPQDVLDRLPYSQAGLGHHKCAICAFEEGFTKGRAEGSDAALDEIEALLNTLRESLPDYDLHIVGNVLQFKCKSENFNSEFPLSVFIAMYRTGQLGRMFLEPAVVPH